MNRFVDQFFAVPMYEALIASTSVIKFSINNARHELVSISY